MGSPDDVKTRPSEVERSYLAGLLDGEGCIELHFGQGNAKGATARISISNIALEMHVWLHEHFGGNAYTLNKHTKCVETRWCSNEDIQSVLEAALPYLIVKKVEAETVLLYVKGARGGGYPHALSLDEQIELVAKIQVEHEGRTTRGMLRLEKLGQEIQ